MNVRSLRHLAEYLAFRLVVCLLDILPVRRGIGLATGLAFVVHRWLPRRWTRYEIARANLKRAFGDRLSDRRIDRIVQGMWVHLFRMLPEIVHLRRKLRRGNCTNLVTFRNREQTVRALCSGRPVILLSGHFGNWELATAMFGLFGFPIGVVARDLDNPWLHEWFARFRQSTGHRLISKKGGGGAMTDFLDHRGHLGLLGDQDAGSKGMFIPFFGAPASTFKSIALLAVHYRAIICVGYACRLKDDWGHHRWVRYEMGTEEVIDPLDFDGPDAVRQITERYTAALERAIRRAPEQYFWVHRRWKSVPRTRRKRRKVAA